MEPVGAAGVSRNQIIDQIAVSARLDPMLRPPGDIELLRPEPPNPSGLAEPP